ncbi:MAG: hypothetical protein Q8L14_18020 [Myxococcales bacterium]|nr:hypothetical protein [Myxococcales bacterium]
MRHLLLVVVGCASAPAFAYSSGLTSSSASASCSACHTGTNGGTTSVGISNTSGSTAGSITAGSGFSFNVGFARTIYVWVRNDVKPGAGYVMTASSGALSAGQGSATCTIAPCVTHNATRAMTGTGLNRAAYFAVTYVGTVAGTVTFRLRGAAVDSLGTVTGDTSDLGGAAPTFTALVCGSNQHACAGACVDNTSVATCGSSCSACPGTSNGSATCNGTTCGLQCNASYHLCGGTTCASNSSTSTCGSSCTPCPSPMNGIATCNGTTCGVQCSPGFHQCGGVCVSNASTATCGGSCTACVPPANATSTCNGTSCDFVCNAGYARSGTTCVRNDTPACCTSAATCPAVCTAPANGTAVCGPGRTCDFTCAINYTKQNGACLLNESPACCGVACATCAAGPANSVPACLQGACDFACNAGFAKNLAGTACVPNLTAACCTSSSVCPAPCPSDANGVAGCGTTGQCTLSCNVGFVACGGVCVPATSPTSCGASCATCAAPVNGTATCDGTSCGFTCAVGFHRCGQACARDDAPETCGASCTPCAAPANSTATCSGGACGFTCDVGYAKNTALTACVPSGTVTCCTTGTTCPAPCAAEPNSVATCSGVGTCDFSCTQGYTRVGAECRLSGSSRCCGVACTDCTMVTVPAAATPTCTADVCGFECAAGFELDASQTRCVPVGNDAGVVDAGIVDAGIVDVDAGTVDAGIVDAGIVDAGSVDPDGGVGGDDAGVAPGSDGGASTVDAGPSPGPGGGSGCGCATSGGAAGWWLALAGLARLARWRRRA